MLTECTLVSNVETSRKTKLYQNKPITAETDVIHYFKVNIQQIENTRKVQKFTNCNLLSLKGKCFVEIVDLTFSAFFVSFQCFLEKQRFFHEVYNITNQLELNKNPRNCNMLLLINCNIKIPNERLPQKQYVNGIPKCTKTITEENALFFIFWPGIPLCN